MEQYYGGYEQLQIEVEYCDGGMENCYVVRNMIMAEQKIVKVGWTLLWNETFLETSNFFHRRIKI